MIFRHVYSHNFEGFNLSHASRWLIVIMIYRQPNLRTTQSKYFISKLHNRNWEKQPCKRSINTGNQFAFHTDTLNEFVEQQVLLLLSLIGSLTLEVRTKINKLSFHQSSK